MVLSCFFDLGNVNKEYISIYERLIFMLVEGDYVVYDKFVSIFKFDVLSSVGVNILVVDDKFDGRCVLGKELNSRGRNFYVLDLVGDFLKLIFYCLFYVFYWI